MPGGRASTPQRALRAVRSLWSRDRRAGSRTAAGDGAGKPAAPGGDLKHQPVVAAPCREVADGNPEVPNPTPAWACKDGSDTIAFVHNALGDASRWVEVDDAKAYHMLGRTLLEGSENAAGDEVDALLSARSHMSTGSREPHALPMPRVPRGAWSRSRRAALRAQSRTLSGEALDKPPKSGATPAPGPAEGPAAGAGEAVRACSSGAGARAAAAPLPPWPCLEGPDRFRRSAGGGGDLLGDPSTWVEVHDVERFNLRGKSYLEDRAKVPASRSAFALHQARLFRTKAPLYHAAGRVPSLKNFLEAHPDRFFIIYNRIVPYTNGTIMNVITLLVRELPDGEDAAFDTLLQRFRTGSDEFRNLRLKHLSCMREAPSAVSNALWLMGGCRPVILGKGYMEQRQLVGPNFVEIDVDVSPSRTARMVVGKVISHGVKVIMEEMLVLEGQSPEELPERPLVAWRWVRVNTEACIIDLDEQSLLGPAA